MSTPFLDHEDPIQGVISEVISAMSALNMNPEPVKDPPTGATYLSDVDVWAAHAMEHLHAVLPLANRASANQARAERQAAEWRQRAISAEKRLAEVGTLLRRIFDAGSENLLGPEFADVWGELCARAIVNAVLES